MTELSKLGRFLFAIAMTGFGIQFLVHALLAGPVPGPPWSPGRPLWAYSTAILLIAAAVCIATGKKMRLAAVLLAILLLLRALLVFAPRLVANIHDPGPWTSGFEILAMAGASLVVAALRLNWGDCCLPVCWLWLALSISCMRGLWRRCAGLDSWAIVLGCVCGRGVFRRGAGHCG